MAAFGKPDRTGRSSGIMSARERKIWGPPKGKPWVWIPAELLKSASWRALSVNARRLIDFLFLEHCNHAGRENGNLIATHFQLREAGMTADRIRAAIEECVELGLIAFERGGRWGGTNQPSIFRLTFYADKNGNPPTNDWRAREAEITAWKKQKAASKSQRTVHLKRGVASLNSLAGK